MSVPSCALQSGKATIDAEARGLLALRDVLDDEFVAAVAALTACTGRVILSGMGKSGHIAAKIAATMASTGTAAFAVHPGEASHGDLGMISPDDAVILISNSGNSAELRDMIAHARRLNLTLIGISKSRDSLVGRAASVFLTLPDVEEACALRLAPTTSTTMTLALGDALCVAVMERKGFAPADFHRFHPGGKLGLDLLQVQELMRPAAQVPQVPVGASIHTALDAMNAGKLGLVTLMDGPCLAGLITDGDVRRNSHTPLADQDPRRLMSTNPLSIGPMELAVTALQKMNDAGVTALMVQEAVQEVAQEVAQESAAEIALDRGESPHPTGQQKQRPLIGLLHIHELLRAGLA